MLTLEESFNIVLEVLKRAPVSHIETVGLDMAVTNIKDAIAKATRNQNNV